MTPDLNRIYTGDCVEVMETWPENFVDTIITDPPYLLDFMGKAWDSSGADIPNSDLVFRAWFAGLVAGEGYFRIHREKDGAYYACHFGIHMRADEGPLLRGLARKLSFGVIKEDPASENGAAVKSSPSIRWEAISREDCWKVARLLDGTPLFGKKQREFDLWRKALAVWTETKRGNRWHGPRDNTSMEKLWLEMKELRPFDEELAASNFNPFGQSNYLFHYRWAKEALRVAKPGATLLSFGGMRTHHHMVCAIEDAGWEIRDSLCWLFGQGFPKSFNFKEGPFLGYGTALKPAVEFICMAMKPLDGTFAQNAERWGVAGINVDGGRIGIVGDRRSPLGADGKVHRTTGNAYGAHQESEGFDLSKGRWPANLILDEEAAGMLDGASGVSGSSARPAGEGNGSSMFAGAGRVGFTVGDSGGASRFFYVAKSCRAERNEGCEELPQKPSGMLSENSGQHITRRNGDAPGPAANNHPTVKPLDLMKYLCVLTRTPTGGIVLDPFAGSGTTLWAAEFHNRPWLGIEMNPEYVAIAEARIARERAQMKMAI